MQYWSADTARLPEVLPPLFAFLQRLATSGRDTAREMYGCGGWVAHGFTDGYMPTGVTGAYIWALCVTCGAWIALHVWDHLTYSMDLAVVTDHLLPLFHGISVFFTEYMWTDNNGQLHTGPTTSPENSYSTKGGDAFQLSMTPAIDMSVLRQVG